MTLNPLTVVRFTVSLVYYGVTFGSVDLGWNIYLTFALTSLVEIPSNLAAIYYGGRFVTFTHIFTL